jgi:hypothetical protein
MSDKRTLILPRHDGAARIEGKRESLLGEPADR